MVERVRCPRCSTVFPVSGRPLCPHCGLTGRVAAAPAPATPSARPAPGSTHRPARRQARDSVVAAVAVVALLLLAGLVTALVYDGPDAPPAGLVGTDGVRGGASGGAGGSGGPGDGSGAGVDADTNTTVPEARVDTVAPNATVGGDGPTGPAPAVFAFKGAGDEVTDAFATEQGLLRLTLVYLGDETFGLTLVNLDDDNVSRRPVYASARGDHESVRYVGLPPGRYVLDVHGVGGAWEVRVEQPRVEDAPAAPRQWSGDGDGDGSGAGDRVFTAEGEVTFHTAHTAPLGEFVVRLYDAHGNLVRRGGSEAVVSDYGDHAGSVTVALPAAGTYFVDVQAAGAWSVEVSR